MKIYISKARELKDKYSNFNDWKSAMIREYGKDVVYKTDEIWKILLKHDKGNDLIYYEKNELKKSDPSKHRFESDLLKNIGKEAEKQIKDQLTKRDYLINQIIKIIITKNPKAIKLNKIAESIESDVSILVSGKGDKTDLIYRIKKKIGDDISLGELETLINNFKKNVNEESVKHIHDLENFREELHIIFWLKLVGIAFLLISFVKLPIGFYTLLRIIITGISAYSSYIYFTAENKFWMWSFGVIAIIFNPIIPIYLTKETWTVIDIVTVAIFLVSIFNLKEFRKAK